MPAVCVLFAFSPLTIYYSAEGRMYSLLWLCLLATTWISLVMQRRGDGVVPLRALDPDFGRWIFDPLFLRVSMVGDRWIPVERPGKLKRLHLAVCVLATALLILPWYVRLPESLAGWRITKDWLKSRPSHFSLLVVLRDNVFQFFSGHERHLWEGCRISSIVAFMLFAAVAALALWRRRLRVLSRDRLLLALVFAAACAGPFAFDVLQHTYTIAWPRYAISALPAAYLLAAAGLACLRPRTRIIMLSLIVLAWIPNLVVYESRPISLEFNSRNITDGVR